MFQYTNQKKLIYIILKGFNLLPQPSECDLYFDIESVEDHIYPGGLEYLLGIYYIENGKEKFQGIMVP